MSFASVIKRALEQSKAFGVFGDLKIPPGSNTTSGNVSDATTPEAIAAIQAKQQENLGKPTYPYQFKRFTADDISKYGIGKKKDDEEKSGMLGTLGMKKGGSVKSYSIDGIAKRGKTRAKLKGK